MENTMIDKLGDLFYTNLEKHSIDFENQMTSQEIETVLNEFIAKDLERAKRFQLDQNLEKPIFHLLFHPE